MRSLLDYVSLSPTRHPIDVGDAQRLRVRVGESTCEAIHYRHPADGKAAVDLIVLKFVGASGRAENLTPHPLERWPEVAAEFWSINPPGFGNSRGSARMATVTPTALALYDHALTQVSRDGQTAPKVLLMGTSLGAATALAVASRRRVDALLLRDAPQLRHVIQQRFDWWTFGMASVSARKLPEELDAFESGSNCDAPALFITSGRDRIVPINIQRQVVERYAGAKRIVHFPNADHGAAPEQEDLPAYFEALAWLRAVVFD